MPADDRDGAFQRLFDRLRGRYAFKIAAAVIIVSAALLGAGALAVDQVQASVESDARETLTSSAEREAEGIEAFLDEVNGHADRIASTPGAKSERDERIREVLWANEEMLPEYVVNLHYLDLTSKEVLVSTSPAAEGTTFTEAERPWAVGPDAFETTREVRSFEPYGVDGENRLGFATPVEKPTAVATRTSLPRWSMRTSRWRGSARPASCSRSPSTRRWSVRRRVSNEAYRIRRV